MAAAICAGVADTAVLRPGGGRGGDLYHMGNGLLIFARADDGADQLFHGALLSTVNYLLIVISAEERSAMEQLSTSGSGGTVTAIIDTPRDGAPARRRCAPAPSGAHDSLSHLHLLLEFCTLLVVFPGAKVGFRTNCTGEGLDLWYTLPRYSSRYSPRAPADRVLCAASASPLRLSAPFAP